MKVSYFLEGCILSRCLAYAQLEPTSRETHLLHGCPPSQRILRLLHSMQAWGIFGDRGLRCSCVFLIEHLLGRGFDR